MKKVLEGILTVDCELYGDLSLDTCGDIVGELIDYEYKNIRITIEEISKEEK